MRYPFNNMCEEACTIAKTIQTLIDKIPVGEDTHLLEHLKTKVFYYAPEICHEAWQNLYLILRHKYDTGEEYQHSMCDAYNRGYKDYVEKFIKDSI